MSHSIRVPPDSFRNCRELEAYFGSDDCKCSHYRKYFPDCACELTSVSEYSPGVVQDEEMVVRTIFNPAHIDPDGHLSPSYFRATMGRKGLSIDRLLYINEEQLIKQKRDTTGFSGDLYFVKTSVRELRQVRDSDGTRLFAIYDTATVDNHAHAEVCMNLYFEKGTRSRLQKNMNIVLKLRQIFGACERVPADADLDN